MFRPRPSSGLSNWALRVVYICIMCALCMCTTLIAQLDKHDDGLYWQKHVVLCWSNTYHLLDTSSCVIDCNSLPISQVHKCYILIQLYALFVNIFFNKSMFLSHICFWISASKTFKKSLIDFDKSHCFSQNFIMSESYWFLCSLFPWRSTLLKARNALFLTPNVFFLKWYTFLWQAVSERLFCTCCNVNCCLMWPILS
jgi:hypothetical protein